MAPHHGSSSKGAARRHEAVPRSARQARLKKDHAGSSGAHHVQEMLVLLPMGTVEHGTRKHFVVGEVQSA